MSVFDEDPDHFVRFLSHLPDAEAPGDHAATLARCFAPRRAYGRYLGETLRSQPRYPSLQHLRQRAIDIERDGDGGNRIHLASGTVIRTGFVILAIGNAPRALPSGLVHGRVCVADAWNYAAVRDIGADEDVCVVGSGLSMVDAVLSLAHDRHRGRIHVLSRHGLTPLPHAAPGPRDGGIDDLLSLPLPARMRVLRRRVRNAVAAGEPWQWTFDRLRPHGTALWQSMNAAGQRRFLRHAARYWDIHRHRIAPQADAVLRALRGSGQLDVLAGRLLSIHGHDDDTATVRYRPRRAADPRTLRVDRIVNATGLETAIDRRPDPLLRALRSRGRIAPGPHGLGIASTGVGHVLDTDGRADPTLLTLGALRIGDLWESIAIPELRVQARCIADHIGDGYAIPGSSLAGAPSLTAPRAAR